MAVKNERLVELNATLHNELGDYKEDLKNIERKLGIINGEAKTLSEERYITTFQISYLRKPWFLSSLD